MDYQKFLQDISGINFTTPELTRTIKNFIIASAKAEKDHEIAALKEQIEQLKQQTKKPPALANLQRKYEEDLQILTSQSRELGSKIEGNTDPHELPDNFIVEFSRAFRNVNYLQRVLLNAPEGIRAYEANFILALLANLNPNELQIQLGELPQESLTDIIKSSNFTYERAQDDLLNPPKDHEEQIAQDHLRRLRDQAQNLAQKAALVIVKQECTICRDKKGQEDAAAAYITLLNNVRDLIPEIGSSTIFDNIDSTHIAVDPANPKSEQETISQLLFNTRQQLGINDLPWLDATQMKILAPSRQVFQKLRFGQEDRRVYEVLRKKNLKNDLFSARNTFDIQAFTGDSTSEDIFRFLEKKHYERQIREKIREQAHIAQTEAERYDQALFYHYYHSPIELKQEENYQNERTREEYKLDKLFKRLEHYKKMKADLQPNPNQPIQAFAGLTQTEFNVIQSKLTIRKITEARKTDAYRTLTFTAEEIRSFRDELIAIKNLERNKSKAVELQTIISKLKTKPAGVDKRNSVKAALLESVYTIRNLERILSSQAAARDNLPCPEPLITIDSETGLITVELNFFPDYQTATDIKDVTKKIVSGKDYDPNLNIETRVDRFISAHGGVAVQKDLLTGKTIKELRSHFNLTLFRDNPAVKEKFDKALAAIEKKVVQPARSAISELKISDTQTNATIRKMLELRSFFMHARNERNESRLAKKVGLKEQEQKLKPLFDLLDHCDYDNALQTPELEQILANTFTWIAALPPEPMPTECKKTYEKADRIAVSSRERFAAASALDAALDPANFADPQKKELIDQIFVAQYGADAAPETQADAIRTVFRKEYGSDMATEALGMSQKSALSDIDVMAEEYVQFSERTERGEFSLSSDDEKLYFDVLNQIAEKIRTHRDKDTLGDLNEVAFKLSHKLKKGKNTILITGKNGAQLSVQITIKSSTTYPFPYSLNKFHDSNKFLFSYGGSRGAVGQLPDTEKERYFTNWRLYGLGHYGTVTRFDDLVTGEGSIVKSGFVGQPDADPTYEEALRQNPRYGDWTSRDDDPELEYTILQAVDRAKQSHDASSTEHYGYHTETERPKQIRRNLESIRFKMLQPLAKGMSFKDTTDLYSSNQGKGTLAFHRPHLSGPKGLEESLALSMAIAEKAQQYRDQGLTHNDIKPENFMTIRRPDGTYIVEFIDWATGGFAENVTLDDENVATHPQHLFRSLFSVAPITTTTFDDGTVECKAEGGRFLAINGNQIQYGVRPSLEILHGKRNCTLPYIAPKLTLGENYDASAADAGVTDPSLNTDLNTEEKKYAMDDWALTALSFGICNRVAYFKLAHGRTIKDYAVPGVIDAVGNDLVIKNPERFSEFFAPSYLDPINQLNLNDPTAVMLIPSTKREGEPIHLYQQLTALLMDPRLRDEAEIKDRITEILRTVYNSVSQGVGLPLSELQTQLQAAKQVLLDIEQQQIAKKSLQQDQIFQKVLEQSSQFLADPRQFLLRSEEAEHNNIEILCLYPTNPGALNLAIEVIKKIPEKWLQATILGGGKESVLRNLIQMAITYKQPEMLTLLLQKIQSDPKLYALLEEQGLLLYALQEGMTPQARDMIHALPREVAILPLLLAEYGAGQDKPYITWHKNAFHAALRNNQPEQLALILGYLPETQPGATPNPVVRQAIKEALYFAADLLKPEYFLLLKDFYNSKNSDDPITTQEILEIRDPAIGTCPYHFFLSKPSLSNTIPWDDFQTLATSEEHKLKVKQFVTQAPYPYIIAAQNHNFHGLNQLFLLTAQGLVTAEENRRLLLQTDLNGDNLLTHIFASHNTQTITHFKTALYQQPGMDDDVLFTLLTHDAPNNPVTHYLQSPKSSTQDKAAILTLFLKQIVKETDASIDQQRKARDILFAHSDWLIAEASRSESQPALQALLNFEDFSRAAKLSLFTELERMAKEQLNNTAQTFYSEQRQTLQQSPQRGATTVALDFSAEDLAVIHRQKHGARLDVLGDILAQNKLSYEELRKEDLRSIQELKATITTHTRTISDLREANNQFREKENSTVEQLRQAIELKKQKEEEIVLIEKRIVLQLQNIEKSHNSNLQAQEASFKEELQKLERLLEQATSSKNQSQERVVVLERELFEIKELQALSEVQITELKFQLQDLNSRFSSQKEAADLLQLQYELLNVETDTKTKEIKNLTRSSLELMAKFEQTKEELVQLQRAQELSGEQNTHKQRELQKQIETLKQELTAHLETITSKTSELKELNAAYLLLQASNEDVISQNTQLLQNTKRLESSLESITTEARTTKSRLEATILEHESLIQTLRIELKGISTQLEEEQVTTSSLRSQLGEVNHKLSEALLGGKESSRALEDLQHQHDSLRQQLEQSERLVLSLQQDILTLKSTHAELLSKNERTHRVALQDLETQLDKQSHKAEAFLAELQEEKEKTQRLTSQVSAMTIEITEIKTTLEAKSRQITKLEEALQNKTREFNELVAASENSALDTAQQQRELKKQIETLKQELTAHLETITSKTSELKELNAAYLLLQASNEDVISQNTQLLQNTKRLESSLESITTEARTTKSRLEATILEHESLIQTLRIELKGISTQLEEEQVTTSSLRSQLGEVNHKLSEALLGGKESSRALEDLQHQHDSLRQQLEQSERLVLSLQQDILTLKSTHAELLSKNERTHRVALQDLETQLDEQSHKAEAFLAELQEEKEKTQRLTSQVSSMTIEITEIKTTLEAKSRQITKLEEALQNKTREFNELVAASENSALDTAQQQRELKKQIETLKQELTAHLETIASKTSELKELNAAYLLLQASNEDVISQNTQLLQNTKRLESSLESITTEARTTKSRLEATILEHESLIQTLRIELKGISTQLEEEQVTTSSLRSQLGEVNHKLSEALLGGKESSRALEDLQHQHDSLRQQLEQSERLVLSLQQDILTLKSTHAELLSKNERTHRVALQDLETQLDEQSHKAEAFLAELQEEKEQTRQLTNKLVTAHEEIDELKSTVRNLTSQLRSSEIQLQSAQDTTRELRDDLFELQEELRSNQSRQSELSLELRRSKGQNTTLTQEFDALQEQYSRLQERQTDLLLALESSERKNEFLVQQISELKEQNARVIEDNKAILDEHRDLRRELFTQHSTILHLTAESEKLLHIIGSKDVEIFDLQAVIDERNHRIRELERKCEHLQQGLKEQLAHSVSVHDLEDLQDRLDSNHRILSRTNDYVADLESENARLLALLNGKGNQSQTTGMGTNMKGRGRDKHIPTRSWADTHRKLRDESDYWRSDRTDSADESTDDDDIEVSRVVNPSLQNSARNPKRGSNVSSSRHTQFHRGPPTHDHRRSHLESDDEEYGQRYEERRAPTYNGNRRGSRPQDGRGRARYLDDSDGYESDDGRNRYAYNDERDPEFFDDNRGRHRPYDGRRGPHHRDRDDLNARHSHPSRHSSIMSPRSPASASPSITRLDLPAMSSTATRAEATIAVPRKIEDVYHDINRGIGAPNAHYTNGIIGTAPATPTDPDSRYVRLASVVPGKPDGKLLDADLDKVTVYRRFTESTLNPADKARIILSSMGIPPDTNKGFELPSELVINGSSDPDDPRFAPDGRNNNSVAVIKEMFSQYQALVEAEELAARSGAGGRPSSII